METKTLRKPLLAWHFGGNRLGFRDGRRFRIGARQKFRPTSDGHTKLRMCYCGMHASVDILDALSYAQGTIIRRVELSGKAITDKDKICAEYRKALWALDSEKLLRRFACRCALDVIDLWSAPEVVVQYLRTQDETIRAAAWDAARAAAWDAARAAAWDAARAAAWDAARAAAWDAARAAAWKRQRRRLLAMIYAVKRAAC
ncbi:hypothetical protein LCGC14_0839660 [marine sediment metagenome]|uniref:Uncharacterized protein n=1 Tax=marine sediment metagenome TaxID=412755 RepID=A0A0F9SKW4_9ZZZZ